MTKKKPKKYLILKSIKKKNDLYRYLETNLINA